MAVAPINIFSQRILPRGVLMVLRKLALNHLALDWLCGGYRALGEDVSE